MCILTAVISPQKLSSPLDQIYIGHSKFPIQADKGEHSWQLSGWCQLKVFCSILLKSFQNSCILKICMSFQRIEFKVYIFTAVIHWGSRMRDFFRTRYWIDLKSLQGNNIYFFQCSKLQARYIPAVTVQQLLLMSSKTKGETKRKNKKEKNQENF